MTPKMQADEAKLQHDLSAPTKLKVRGDYAEHFSVKDVDGKPVKVVDIDAMSEDQFKKYCRDMGTEWFQR